VRGPGERAGVDHRLGRPAGPLDVVDLPDTVPGDGQQPSQVSSSGVDVADTHHRLSAT
jgi:hypothetical protein